MRDRLDRSKRLGQAIRFLSSSLSELRGLVPLIGILFVFIGFVSLMIDAFAGLQWLYILGLLLQNIGILIALVGLLLSEPLGK